MPFRAIRNVKGFLSRSVFGFLLENNNRKSRDFTASHIEIPVRVR